MLIHEKSEWIRTLQSGHGMVLFFPGVDNGVQRIEQGIKRMPLISAHFIDQAVKPCHGQVVFPLVPDFE